MTDAERLEQSQWDLFWIPADAHVTERTELLLVRCDRPVGYLNVVLRGRSPALVDEVAGVFGPGRGRWMVTDTAPRASLQDALAARGWQPGARHEVRTLPVDAVSAPPAFEVRTVRDMPTLLDCVRVADAGFGVTTSHTPGSLALDLRQCVAGARVRRVVAYDGDVPVACGGLTAFPSLGFGLLWAGCTVPEARGRGAYRAVLAARIAHARALGLRVVGLYAREDTSAPIVARQGFRLGGEMHFWAPKPLTAGSPAA